MALSLWSALQDLYKSQEFAISIHVEGAQYETETMD